MRDSFIVDIVEVEKRVQQGAGDDGELPAIARGPAKFKWYQTAPSTNRSLFNVCGFVYNLAAYFFVSSLSLRCIELGARSFELGIVNGVLAFAGTVGCLAAGWISDRVSTSIVARVGAGFYLLAAVLLIVARSLPLAFAAAICAGLSEAAFWPSIEGQIGRESDRSHSDHSAALFNVFMAVGKSTGCILAGFLFPRLGNTRALLVVIIANLFVLVLVPLGSRVRARRAVVSNTEASGANGNNLFIELSDRSMSMSATDSALSTPSATPRLSLESMSRPLDAFTGVNDATPRLSVESNNARPSADSARDLLPGGASNAEDAADIRRARLYLPLALLGNAVLYGVAGVFGSLYPEFAILRGLTVGKIGGSAELYGLVMGILWAMQALAFAVLSTKRIKWQYHRVAIYVLELLAIAAILAISFASAGWQALLLAALVGSCTGFLSMSSLAYSLRASENSKGKFAGVHEALQQLGVTVMPIIAGFLVTGTTEARSAYWLCSGLLLVAVFTQELVFHDKKATEHQRRQREMLDNLAWLRRSRSIPSISSVVSPSSTPSLA